MPVQSVSIQPVTAFVAAAALSASGGVAIAMSPITTFAATANLTVSVVQAIQIAPKTAFNGSATLTGGTDTDGMTLCDVLDVVLGMWAVFNRCSAPDFAKDEAINIINASLQLVWNNADGRNYWSNETLTITLADSESSQDLPDNIQNVTGPCRRADNKRPLAPIGTIGELETFPDLYLENQTAEEPLAYHIERTNQVGNDPARTIFHVTPPVTGDSLDFLLEVVKEAPRYTINDLTACPVIPIPHRYVESLLLPIARYQASTFHLFRKTDQKETIDREYKQARISLGLADPLPGKAGDNKEGTPSK
jgi:hypothetical protein